MNQMTESNFHDSSPLKEVNHVALYRIPAQLTEGRCPEGIENVFERPTTPHIQRELFAEKRIHLKQKLEKLRARIQETERKSLEHQKQHKEILQLADKSFEKGKTEQEGIENIEKDEKNIDQQREIISNELIVVKERMAHVNQEQEEIRQRAEGTRQASLTVPLRCGLLESKLTDVSERLVQVTRHQEKIQRQQERIQGQAQILYDQQKDVERRIHTLMIPADEKTQKVSQRGSNHEPGIETLKTFVEHDQVFDKERMRGNLTIDLVSEKLNKVWGKVRKRTSLTSLFALTSVTNGTIDRLQAISEIAKEGMKVSQGLVNRAVRWSLNIAWTSLKEMLGPIAGVALGVLGICFVIRVLASYPGISLLIGGCVFFIFRGQLQERI